MQREREEKREERERERGREGEGRERWLYEEEGFPHICYVHIQGTLNHPSHYMKHYKHTVVSCMHAICVYVHASAHTSSLLLLLSSTHFVYLSCIELYMQFQVFIHFVHLLLNIVYIYIYIYVKHCSISLILRLCAYSPYSDAQTYY